MATRSPVPPRSAKPTASCSQQFIRSFRGYVIYVGDVDGPTSAPGDLRDGNQRPPSRRGTARGALTPASRPASARAPSCPRASHPDAGCHNQVLQSSCLSRAVDVASWSPLHLRDAVRTIPWTCHGRARRATALGHDHGQLLSTYYELRSAGSRSRRQVQMHRQRRSRSPAWFHPRGIPWRCAPPRETSAGVGCARAGVLYHASCACPAGILTRNATHLISDSQPLFHGWRLLLWNATGG